MSAVMREGAYRGGSRMAADWSRAKDGPPADEQQDVDEPEPVDDEDQDDAGDAGDDEDQDDEPAGDEGPAVGSSSGWGQDGAGWVLGLLLWGWVALPFLKGGPKQVRAVLLAKFLNRAPDGSELP